MKNKISFDDSFRLLSKCSLLFLLFTTFISTPLTAFSHSNLIQKILKNGVSVEYKLSTINLKTSDNISIVLGRISDTLSYKYQCIGKDSLFLVDSNNVVSYSNFSADTFFFVANTDDHSEENIRTQSPLIINVQSSFLDSWGFTNLLLIYILLLLIGASYFIILSNYRNKLKLLDLRNDWTNKLHNDIGADLSSVALHINILNRRMGKLDPALKEKVGKVLTILNSIQGKLRFVFDLVDPKKNSLRVMLSEIESFATENFELKQISLDYDNKLNAEKNFQLNIGQINKIYLVMKEAINNAVKHSNATNASIKIIKVKEGISISIKDDGLGFDSNKQYDGNGINNLIEYGREGFMNVQIDSIINEGTEVKILVPKI